MEKSIVYYYFKGGNNMKMKFSPSKEFFDEFCEEMAEIQRERSLCLRMIEIFTRKNKLKLLKETRALLNENEKRRENLLLQFKETNGLS